MSGRGESPCFPYLCSVMIIAYIHAGGMQTATFIISLVALAISIYTLSKVIRNGRA